VESNRPVLTPKSGKDWKNLLAVSKGRTERNMDAMQTDVAERWEGQAHPVRTEFDKD